MQCEEIIRMSPHIALLLNKTGAVKKGRERNVYKEKVLFKISGGFRFDLSDVYDRCLDGEVKSRKN